VEFEFTHFIITIDINNLLIYTYINMKTLNVDNVFISFSPNLRLFRVLGSSLLHNLSNKSKVIYDIYTFNNYKY